MRVYFVSSVATAMLYLVTYCHLDSFGSCVQNTELKVKQSNHVYHCNHAYFYLHTALGEGVAV